MDLNKAQSGSWGAGGWLAAALAAALLAAGPARAQVTGLVIQVKAQDVSLTWKRESDAGSYTVYGWRAMGGTRYWMSSRPEESYYQANALNMEAKWFYQVWPRLHPPQFSPPAGTYFEEQKVEVTCASQDATLYYTTNNASPTTNSAVYREPVLISRSARVYARATRPGFEDYPAYADYKVLAPQILWMPFQGNANDESGQANHGIVSNATLCPDQSGTPDSAYRFNGSNSTIQVRTEAPFDPVELTLAATVNMAQVPEQGQFYCVATKGTGFGAFYLGLKRPTGGAWPPYAQLTYLHRTAAGNWVTAVYSISFYPNTHYHVAFTRSASQVKLYVNGLARATTDYATPPLANDSPVTIGSSQDPSWNDTMNGVIDNVRVFGRELTASELQALYNVD